MSENLKIARQVKGLPDSSGALVVLILLAVLTHFLVIALLPNLSPNRSESSISSKPIRMAIAKPPMAQKDPNKILFSKQTETAPPKQPDFYSFEDHQAKKESRLTLGKEGEGTKTPLKADAKPQESTPEKTQTTVTQVPKPLSRDEAYQKFLPSKQLQAAETAAGYKDYVDQQMTLGETVDANSLKNPLMGFFAQIRRNVELAFYDPSELEVARYLNSQGFSSISGSAIALIEIDKSGKITDLKLANPSGHSIIDNHWLKILRASSPFQPIPKSWPKDHLRFSYTLNYRYGSG